MTTSTAPTAAAAELTPEFLGQVRGLSVAAKEHLLDILLAEPDASENARKVWQAEIARRIDAVRDGTMPTYTLDETMAHLRQALAGEGSR